MKSIRTAVLGLAAALALSPAFGAEDFTLWAETTFAGPYTDGVIATSPTISNNNGLNSLEAVIEFVSATPDQCNDEPADYKIYLKAEGNINGIWFPIATSFSKYNNCNDGQQRILILSPDAPDLDAADYVLAEGFKTIAKQSYNRGALPDQFRVKVILQQGTAAPLTSVTLRGFGRKYNTQ